MYIALRWFDRFIGVISTVVLARLLVPDDFGIVALATIALGLASVLFDMGINISVVQREYVDRDDLDTAWTLKIIQHAIVAAALALSASLFAEYFNDQRITLVIYVLAFGYLLGGFGGMGPIMFQKQQRYAREVAYFMAKRSIGFAVTVFLAFLLRSYWALIIGSVLSTASGVWLSYAMHRVAPRLTLVRWRVFLGPSVWLTIKGVGVYASSQLDKFIVGRRDGTETLGAYSLADQISAMPSSEMLAPMSRALFPAMVTLQNNLDRLRQLYLYALGVQSTIALPASVGLALVSEEMVLALLGEKWIEAAPIMTALALAYGCGALMHSGGYLMTALGKFRVQATIQWIMLIGLILLIVIAFPTSGGAEIAWFRTLIESARTVVTVGFALMCLPSILLSDFLRTVARPLASTATMAVGVIWLGTEMIALSTWQLLVIKIGFGAALYLASLLALWRILGYPDGAEKWILERIRAARQKYPVSHD